ncbi:MAG: 3-keto-5-aminohexanoate cleavage protein [Solirubrobacteraceae bacterium]
MLLVEACLNGSRTDAEHPAVPRTPTAIAEAARASVEAGAGVLHVHAYDTDGAETLAAEPCAAVLRAIRAVCPGVPVSLTTSADIEGDPAARHALVAEWTELPELVTANQGEPGIVELCELLIGRGVGIEAGLLTAGDAHAFVASGLAGRCARVLMEPLDREGDAAVAHAAEMERVVLEAGIALEQVHHGDDLASWAVMRRAYAHGYGTRAGIEDMTVLPDGSLASGNAALVRAAVELQGSAPPG